MSRLFLNKNVYNVPKTLFSIKKQKNLFLPHFIKTVSSFAFQKKFWTSFSNAATVSTNNNNNNIYKHLHKNSTFFSTVRLSVCHTIQTISVLVVCMLQAAAYQIGKTLKTKNSRSLSRSTWGIKLWAREKNPRARTRRNSSRLHQHFWSI